MATVTHEISTVGTANTTSYTSGAFIPATNDLLLAFVAATATVIAGTMTSSIGGQTFSKVTTSVTASSANTLHCFVSDQLVSGGSQTVTFDCTGDSATQAIIEVASITGMSVAGLSAIRQTSGQSNQAGSTTPAPAFTVGCLTGNPSLGAVYNASNPAGLSNPTGWVILTDTGGASPTGGITYIGRDNGFTGTTVTWGSTSATAFCSMMVELAAVPEPLARRELASLQAVNTAAVW